eukprot:CAMPEP_0204520104 /NCGR_PEP_ID=MMETSP0661-20131031/5086_1 /ASSEMBLY_ACC=CAM_ASM_000606 /TAXON_ID=109239 /ORGANISM="Alexandrium margalefi, Strain AMGDE01CS-322" /LENGTH=72 /DNA_ID=CAMNT_0051525643 /DNA_START=299 /DNA_END=514 /DNA_ORIENTATION=-
MIPGAVEVEVSCGKHAEFMAYWDASQRKRYTQQQQQQKKVAETGDPLSASPPRAQAPLRCAAGSPARRSVPS